MAKDGKRAMTTSPDYGKTIAPTDFRPDNRDNRGAITNNNAEDKLLDALDQRSFLKKHSAWVEKLHNGEIDVQGALGDLAPDMLINLAHLSLSRDVSAKTRLAAIQDWLDRAGYSKVQKIAAAMVDPNAPKEQLLNIIESLGKKNKVIEIVDDHAENKEK